MVELVDTYALGAYAAMRVGSSPTIPTKIGLGIRLVKSQRKDVYFYIKLYSKDMG